MTTTALPSASALRKHRTKIRQLDALQNRYGGLEASENFIAYTTEHPHAAADLGGCHIDMWQKAIAAGVASVAEQSKTAKTAMPLHEWRAHTLAGLISATFKGAARREQEKKQKAAAAHALTWDGTMASLKTCAFKARDAKAEYIALGDNAVPAKKLLQMLRALPSDTTARVDYDGHLILTYRGGRGWLRLRSTHIDSLSSDATRVHAVDRFNVNARDQEIAMIAKTEPKKPTKAKPAKKSTPKKAKGVAKPAARKETTSKKVAPKKAPKKSTPKASPPKPAVIAPKPMRIVELSPDVAQEVARIREQETRRNASTTATPRKPPEERYSCPRCIDRARYRREQGPYRKARRLARTPQELEAAALLKPTMGFPPAAPDCEACTKRDKKAAA